MTNIYLAGVMAAHDDLGMGRRREARAALEAQGRVDADADAALREA